MKLLITGCLGHIGSFLIKNINKINKVKKIYLLDNNSNNKFIVLSFIKKNNKSIKFFLKDVSDPESLNKLPKIDVVLHLASTTDAQSSVGNEKKYIQNNLGSFKNIVKFCTKKKAKLIHISSTSVYGDQNFLVDEKSKFLKPQSPYANIKLEEELILKKFSNKIKYITLRFGTIAGYSEGMRFHTAVNKFCFNTILNKPIPVWKTAIDQYRPYLSLADAFKTFKFIIEKNIFPNDVFNVLSENKTVRQIINDIKDNGFKPKISITNSKIMNQLSYKVSSEKINNIGLILKTKIKKEIKSTLKKFSQIKND
jgi:UDP-glucose 4-epimerase